MRFRAVPIGYQARSLRDMTSQVMSSRKGVGP